MAESKTDSDIFSKSGPSHLKSIDWTDLSHQTAVAASLVKGVSVLERLGPNSQAEPWWESFNFTLLEKLVNEDDDNNAIYGAIFEYQDTHLELSQRYVIAFRGTILKWKTRADIILISALLSINSMTPPQSRTPSTKSKLWWKNTTTTKMFGLLDTL
ncbi:hypothetical protein EUTSA_v10017864mg [Eutrema salsugineum]|uniref:Uncharacterized protein n=1 Tax=Eutrema salsugineum TaxID=72664 RepID=V4M5N9_EUTSA|nr:hypothetical protein EUTSA_v10017864mg [Eutrema salsugineum]